MKYKIIRRGAILEGNDLEIEYRVRKKPFEKSIEMGAEIPPGWKVKKEFKTKTRIYREKSIGEELEDKVWRLFYEMGVKKLSSRYLTILLRTREGTIKTQEIDVLAIDDNVVFVVECKSQKKLGEKKQKKEIALFSQNMKYIRTSLKKLLGIRELQFVFVFATENIEWDQNDRLDAKENEILIWDEYDILALQNLANLAGEGAKYQIYNRIFYGKKIKNFEIKVPALKSKMGGHTYYSFILSPEHLLKIAYIHHRSKKCSFLELADSYQRMINKTRIRKIKQFVQDKGFFPGSIIINFRQNFAREEILGNKKIREEIQQDGKPVVITLPPYYGCAWIIDGQHRLYGYADTDEKLSETVPVIAFVEEPEHVQSKIFVDINKNQKSIEADLLWDLYEDLYLESKKERERQLYVITKIAKILNSDPKSPFYNSITIPKEQNEGNISLTTVCTNIDRQKLISKKENLLFHNSYKDTINYGSERIANFFDIIRKELEDMWNLGDKNYIKTNSGFVVLLGIFRDLVECNLSPSEIKNITHFRKAIYKFLEPLLLHFLEIDNDKIRSFRGAGGAGQKSRQVRYELTKVIVDAKVGYRSIWMEKYEKSLEEEDIFAKKRKGIVYYLDKDEGDVIEFKASSFLDVNRLVLGDGKIDKKTQICDDGVLKSIVGFLNSKGGDILIGILERPRFEKVFERKLSTYETYKDKIIYGIENEYDKDGWDGYLRKLTEAIEKRVDPEIIDAELVKIEKKNYKDTELCLIKVMTSEAKQYLKGNKFYVRRFNRTVSLEGKEIDKYWTDRKR